MVTDFVSFMLAVVFCVFVVALLTAVAVPLFFVAVVKWFDFLMELFGVDL